MVCNMFLGAFLVFGNDNCDLGYQLLGSDVLQINIVYWEHQLRCLDYVLRMSAHRLPYRVLYEWKKRTDDQTMIWYMEMNRLSLDLTCVWSSHLYDCESKDVEYRYLEIFQDMASTRSQWHECISTCM